MTFPFTRREVEARVEKVVPARAAASRISSVGPTTVVHGTKTVKAAEVRIDLEALKLGRLDAGLVRCTCAEMASKAAAIASFVGTRLVVRRSSCRIFYRVFGLKQVVTNLFEP